MSGVEGGRHVPSPKKPSSLIFGDLVVVVILGIRGLPGTSASRLPSYGLKMISFSEAFFRTPFDMADETDHTEAKMRCAYKKLIAVGKSLEESRR